MDNVDMSKIMAVLSKMDKKDLEAGIAKANQILQTKSKEDIINDIKKSNS